MNSIEVLERKMDQLLKEHENSQLINEIGVLLYRLKDWNNAEKYFQRAYGLNPYNQDILYNYASVLYLQSQWQKAVNLYRACLKICPDDAEAAEKLGDSYYHLGEYESAAMAYDQLQKIKKGSPGS